MLTERNQTVISDARIVLNHVTAYSKRIPATELAVRHLLEALCTRLQQQGVPTEAVGRVEIVMAEALNNIVEHGYANSERGKIDLRAEWSNDQLTATILDSGTSAPAHLLSAERQGPDINVDLHSLPEGGFGWMMIQSMTINLSYSRFACLNCLRFTILFNPD
jgi:serine/threonine-protein kinase RsbW